MPTFWDNVLQLARFFISSVTGLIFIILSPLIALKRKPLLFSGMLVFSLLILFLLFQVLQEMLGIT
nr:Ycf33 [Sahlingia subintegra]